MFDNRDFDGWAESYDSLHIFWSVHYYDEQMMVRTKLNASRDL